MRMSSRSKAGARRLMRLTPTNAFAELIDSLGLWRLWLSMGWTDIKQRYRNSVLGPFWLASGLALTIAGMSLLYSQILHVSYQQFAPYLAAGLMIWTFIASTATESCHGYLSAEGLIKSLQVPYFVYIFRVVARNLIVFGHNLIVVAIIWIVFGKVMDIKLLETLFGILLLTLFCAGMATVFSAIGAVFKDFVQIVTQVFQVLIFVTPVFWLTNSVSPRSAFLHFNPLYYLMEVVREPLLGTTPTPFVFMGAVGITLASLIAGFAAYAFSRKSIVFYV
jgi:ABC-type polysaccharide/polyol phosphate export permease